MSALVARTGRHQQRYEGGHRLVSGCIPFKYTNLVENSDGTHEKVVEVLMINSTSGPGLVFPKGGWENDETVEEAAIREAVEEAGVRGDIMDFLGHYFFKSKTLQDELSPEGLCKAAVFPLLVKEELQFWPEQNTRQRSWLTIPEAIGLCRHQWMKEALEAFSRWYADQMLSNPKKENHGSGIPRGFDGHLRETCRRS
ncbi:nudix hydrolase 16, mitochondrial [Prunus persica]|uniref:nudix hydrolase 16, mitochondrial n=1 Tax=Prunus persica TaxID=3760 RepID=UPI0009AB89B0|nr:nudix hydrolase 16, mitochondrial [Prunus persica]